MGADAVACAALAGGVHAKAFFVRKDAKAHGLQRRIEGPPLRPWRSLRGRRGRRHERRLDARGDRRAARGGPRDLRCRQRARPARRWRRRDRAGGRRAVRRAEHDRRRLPRAAGPTRPADARGARRACGAVRGAARARRDAGGRPGPAARCLASSPQYEHLEHLLQATEQRLGDALFGERPAAAALLAESGAEAAGYALFFPTFSSFLAIQGVWLEDLYVRPAHRGAGVGRALLATVAAQVRESWRRAPGMVGARLERAGARLLQAHRRADDGRVDHAPARRRGSRAACGRSRR